MSAQVGYDHLYMPGVQHHDHPARVGANHDTVDKQTESWLIPHFVHHILVNFVLCEQFTDNLLMALPTSHQEAVLAFLKEGWQT